MEGATPTPPRLLHDFLERSARQHPDRIAVDVPPGPDRSHRVQLTYRQLLAQSDSLAAMLCERITPDSVVGVLLPRTTPQLYVAQLAVLKAGAAFTCIDPIFPDAHIQAILNDGDVAIVLTDRDGLSRLSRSTSHARQVIDLSDELPALDARSPRTPSTPAHLAYVIYTSGTTGAPKGVMIEHRSIVNLVASDADEFQLTPDDRVAQGSSAAYDSSVEEIWLAFAAGATLVVMDDHTSRLGPDLVPWLRQERVTVFCPPPTLLRTTGCTDPQAALPFLRLLYVGGEALTDDLADRWARGRRLVNGYGPTECTVTVVRGDVVPGRPVTIGRPVPGHSAWILDAELNPLVDGEAGELCISGIGLARGYRNRDDLTREKFPDHPNLGRIYRTGDLVRRDPDGQLVYLGRIDAQVKLRGYRVELEAVEAGLAKCPGVREAACRVQGDGTAAILTAHIVAQDPGTPPDFAAIRQSLLRSLPPYMVPTRLGLIDALPRSIGGKVDRKRLPELAPELGENRRDVVPPANALEATIAAAFQSALKLASPVSTLDDFFIDLGGDSLSAVDVICALRVFPQTASITTRDLYETRTAAKLAARASARPTKPSLARFLIPPAPSHRARPFWVSTVQAAWILLEVLVAGAASYAVIFKLLPMLLQRVGLLGTLLLEIPLVLIGVLVYTLSTILFTVVLKSVLIGKYRPIRIPVWSSFYLRHWIVRSVARAIPWNLLAGTVAYGFVLRLLGAKVGRRVHIHRGVNLQQGGWDLLTLGDDVTISRDAHLGLVELDAGHLCIGPVTIRDLATLDIRAGVSGHTTIETGGFLTALSWLPEGSNIPAGERWDGVPAAPAGVAPAAPPISAGSSLHPVLHAFIQLSIAGLSRAGTALPVLVALYFIALLLGVSAADVAAWLSHPAWTSDSVLWVLGTSVVCVPVSLVLRALSLRCEGRVRPATINRWSLEYIRVWHKTTEVESAGRWLTGTLFWPLWLRLAGMNIGRNCEISTIIDVVPESLRIGPESFFADGIYLGGPRIHRGTVTISDTSLGRGTFLGNHVVIPAGATLPEDLFMGVCTVADAAQARPGTSWFGIPPLELPRRDVVSIDRRLTHDPGPLRYATRLFWETLRFTLPVPPILVGFGWLAVVTPASDGSPLVAVLVASAATLAALSLDCAAVVVLKWLLLGRARAGQHPLWSCWCSRWDFLYVVWQFYAAGPLAVLEGTLLLSFYLRAMGVRIGRRVVLGPGLQQVADPDMIIIEDDATVNANYQAHTFEDRVLKLAPVIVRRGATVGASAVVFYGADIGDDAWVTPNSVVMKNERLAPARTYSGCPVQAHDPDAGESDPHPGSARLNTLLRSG